MADIDGDCPYGLDSLHMKLKLPWREFAEWADHAISPRPHKSIREATDGDFAHGFRTRYEPRGWLFFNPLCQAWPQLSAYPQGPRCCMLRRRAYRDAR